LVSKKIQIQKGKRKEKKIPLDKFLLKQAEIKTIQRKRENGRQFKSHITSNTTTLKNNTRASHRRPKTLGRNNPSCLPDPLFYE
jgi:hypothetical protein